ncbi:MAG TPA: hypothetical protein PKV66_03600 [Candidatus Pelethenecus sp.]|nr:hypothetical protein [Candidatus Pelethenecus sp.]
MNAVEIFIKDIRKALDNDCLWAALSLSLSIPDICGKIKYPNEKPSDRYIKWFDDYLKAEDPDEKEKIPYFNGELFYKLRCAFFHEGTNDVEGNKTSFDLDSFQFIICEKNELEIYADSLSASTPEWYYSDGSKKTGKTSYAMEINIRGFCNKIIWVTESFLKKSCQDKNVPQLKFYNLEERYNQITKKR